MTASIASTVGADHRHRFARTELRVDAEQRLEVAIVGVDAAHIQKRLRHRRLFLSYRDITKQCTQNAGAPHVAYSGLQGSLHFVRAPE